MSHAQILTSVLYPTALYVTHTQYTYSVYAGISDPSNSVFSPSPKVLPCIYQAYLYQCISLLKYPRSAPDSHDQSLLSLSLLF
jgi:hypothetical protein